MRIAIIGSGPAGFYAAEQLLAFPGVEIEVDIFDRLATPWGLVRAGVAPDHPKIKSVTRVYEKTAQRPGFRFHGNVEVGSDVSHEELTSAYHAVIYAVGAPTDRRLGIPGEDLPGSYSAPDFVAWYNGHPDFADLEFDLSRRRAVVVGNGNVALDVARMLAVGETELRGTDIADHALSALAASAVEEIVVLGRRGPVQAAYTNPELRELGEMVEADVVVDPLEVVLDPYSQAFLDSDGADLTTKRNVEIVTAFSAVQPSGKRRRIVLRFLASPLEVVGSKRVEGLRIVRNELVAGADGTIRARPTDQTELLEADLVFRSIGYRGTRIPGVPFDDQRGTIRNIDGRVTQEGSDVPLRGVYTAGWIKRGPSGVIGTNKKCAQGTVSLLLEDLEAGVLATPSADPDDLLRRVAGRTGIVVDYDGWRAIDAHERAAGEAQGRPRVKVVRRTEMLGLAEGGGLGH